LERTRKKEKEGTYRIFSVEKWGYADETNIPKDILSDGRKSTNATPGGRKSLPVTKKKSGIKLKRVPRKKREEKRHKFLIQAKGGARGGSSIGKGWEGAKQKMEPKTCAQLRQQERRRT